MNPNNPYTFAQIARAIEHLTANFKEQLSLGELAETVNLSEFHFQRLFTEWAGVSPKKFGQYLTLEHTKTRLRTGVLLADAAHDAGLSGTGRLHDLFVCIEGVTPGQFKQAGTGLTLTYGVFDSPFGPYVLGAINTKIVLLHFLTDTDSPETILSATWPEATLLPDPDSLQPIANQLFSRTEHRTKPKNPFGIIARIGLPTQSLGSPVEDSGGTVSQL